MMMLGSYCCTGLVVLTTLVLLTQAADPSVTCGAPSQAPHTKPVILTENAKVGDIIQQECIDGYVEDVALFPCECLATGNWDDHCKGGVACKEIPDPPSNLTVGPHRDHTRWDVIDLRWTPPTRTDIVTGYEVRCNNNSWKSYSPRSSGYFDDGITPYSIQSCEIRSMNGPVARSRTVTAPDYRTLCYTPWPPSNLRYSSPTVAMMSGEKKWKYKVSWQVPTEINCDSLHHKFPYQIRYPTESSKLMAFQTNSTVVYVDGDEQITFTVWARSSNLTLRLSNPASITIRSPALLDSPSDVQLSAVDSDCVTLSWKYVEQKSKPTAFQYNCSSSSWSSTGALSRSEKHCGLQPYQLISCDIRTVSGSTYSNISTSSAVRTNCSAPSAPQKLTFGSCTEVYDSGIKKWKYVVSWQAPVSTNCAGLHQMKPYDVRYPSSSSNTTTELSTSTTVYSYGEEEISFTVWARNNDMLLSQPATVTIRTPKIYYVPEAPTNPKLISTDSSCVGLSWDYPGLGNRITNFQYRCDSVSWKTSSSDKRSTVECGFKPYQQVSCDIRTVNDKLYSNISTSLSVRTNCSEPSVPKNLKFGHPYYTSLSGNKKWSYLLSWQAPMNVNCESLDLTNPYMIRFPSESSTTLNVNSTSAVVYADWNELVVFSVWARNRDGLMSQPAFTSITTPAKDMKSSQNPECPKTLSGVADPSTGKGQIELNLADQKQILHLTIGQHFYTTTTDEGSNCSVLLVVYDGQVERRLDFEARYDIPCNILDDSLTSKLILSTARQNYNHVNVLCDGLCTVTDNSSPILSCQNNTLVITWPTETVYRADVTTIPQDVAAKINEVLIQNKVFFPIVIISRVPPIVYPLANKDGTPVRVGLKSQCVTVDGTVYNEVKDVCERSCV